jgi:hypothetical protein
MVNNWKSGDYGVLIDYAVIGICHQTYKLLYCRIKHELFASLFSSYC